MALLLVHLLQLHAFLVIQEHFRQLMGQITQNFAQSVSLEHTQVNILLLHAIRVQEESTCHF
jgi:hypothetical protein